MQQPQEESKRGSVSLAQHGQHTGPAWDLSVDTTVRAQAAQLPPLQENLHKERKRNKNYTVPRLETILQMENEEERHTDVFSSKLLGNN